MKVWRSGRQVTNCDGCHRPIRGTADSSSMSDTHFCSDECEKGYAKPPYASPDEVRAREADRAGHVKVNK